MSRHCHSSRDAVVALSPQQPRCRHSSCIAALASLPQQPNCRHSSRVAAIAPLPQQPQSCHHIVFVHTRCCDCDCLPPLKVIALLLSMTSFLQQRWLLREQKHQVPVIVRSPPSSRRQASSNIAVVPAQITTAKSQSSWVDVCTQCHDASLFSITSVLQQCHCCAPTMTAEPTLPQNALISMANTSHLL